MDRHLLSKDEVEAALVTLDGWSYDGARLKREYRFRDFVTAFAFMSGAALEAQALNHHPEWSNVYDRVRVELWTHDRGGVTPFDLELARRLETIATSLAARSSAGASKPNS